MKNYEALCFKKKGVFHLAVMEKGKKQKHNLVTKDANRCFGDLHLSVVDTFSLVK